jgi:hypothetical protein
MIIFPLVDIQNMDITVGRVMTKDARFTNEINSSIAKTKQHSTSRNFVQQLGLKFK